MNNVFKIPRQVGHFICLYKYFTFILFICLFFFNQEPFVEGKTSVVRLYKELLRAPLEGQTENALGSKSDLSPHIIKKKEYSNRFYLESLIVPPMGTNRRTFRGATSSRSVPKSP